MQTSKERLSKSKFAAFQVSASFLLAAENLKKESTTKFLR